MSAIFERISVRKFEKGTIPEETIRDLIRAGCAAPSAGNQQPWEFYVVQSQEVLDKLSEVHQYAGFVKTADFALVPCYRTEGLWAPYFAEIDMAACVENILVRVTELGLGATWIGIAPEEDRMKIVEEILNLPKTRAPFAILPVGIPAESRLQEDRYDESRIHFIK